MPRRALAILLALCFGLFSVESLVADVHDGDASAAEQSQYADAVHAGQSAADRAGAHTHSDNENADQSGHTLHACHGAHAHTGLTSSGPKWAGSPLRQASATAPSACAPLDQRREPQLRPPIA